VDALELLTFLWYHTQEYITDILIFGNTTIDFGDGDSVNLDLENEITSTKT